MSRVSTLAVMALAIATFATGSLAHAACDSAGTDADDVAAARAAVAAACDCAAAASHGAYVRCARTAARAALTNAGCVGAVVRCAAKSTCGRPGAVACCQTSATGRTRFSVKARAGSCRAPGGGSACVSPHASACDACTSSGCAPPQPTPTPGPAPTPGCGNGIVDPGEDCDGATCQVWDGQQDVESECGAPGSLHACECASKPCSSCTGELCWPSDQCFFQPGGGGCIQGSCVPTVCNVHEDCREPAVGCENGACCVPALAQSGLYCRIDGVLDLPCCLGAICTGGGSFGICCVPAGLSCIAPTGIEMECCSGSCTGGTCD